MNAITLRSGRVLDILKSVEEEIKSEEGAVREDKEVPTDFPSEKKRTWRSYKIIRKFRVLLS